MSKLSRIAAEKPQRGGLRIGAAELGLQIHTPIRLPMSKRSRTAAVKPHWSGLRLGAAAHQIRRIL